MRKPPPHDVTVASVPAAHPYVRGLGLDDAGVRVLDDPPVPGAPPGRWWPPVMLGPDWVDGRRDDFDVMHIHFGVESLSPAALSEVLRALRRTGRPLVHTVHDLSHPQLFAQEHHLAQLSLLVAHADALITLTPGAAEAIETRFGRRAIVLPHPAMRPAGGVPGAPGSGPLVGVHLRDLRPSIDGPGTTASLASALRGLTGVRGRIHLHDRVRDEPAAAAVTAICERSPALDLVRGPRPDDARLEAEISGLAVSLLPYRHGTHSGWLELCVDLGVPVAAPAVGHMVEQHPEPGAVAAFDPGDVCGLRSALSQLLGLPHAVAGSPARADLARERVRRRADERRQLASAHRAIYDDVIRAAGRRAGP